MTEPELKQLLTAITPPSETARAAAHTSFLCSSCWDISSLIIFRLMSINTLFFFRREIMS